MNGNGGLEKIQETVMHWPDWTIMALILFLAVIIIIFGIKYLNKSDSRMAQWTREVTCRMHSWGYKDCDGEKIMYCTKCGKVPGRD